MINRKVKVRRANQPAGMGGGDNRLISTASLSGRSPSSTNFPEKSSIVVATIDDPLQSGRKPGSLAGWIRLICEACSRGTGSTLELARLLSQARRSLPYGRWSQIWQLRMLPFSKRKGEMLVVIGEGVEGIDAQNSAQLPAPWSTLYYLARLGRRTVEDLIAQGRVHPGLSLREAKALLAEFHPETLRRSPRSKLRDRLGRFAAFIRAGLGIWPRTEREWAGRQLMTLVGEFQAFTKPAQSGETKSTRFDSRVAVREAQPASLRRTLRPQSFQIRKL